MNNQTLTYLSFFVALSFMVACEDNKQHESNDNSTAFNYGNEKTAGHFIVLNGAKLFYEEYGKGTPLVLLHGNGGNIAYMKPQIEYFSKKYHVIAMDCRGRGNSELGNDSLTYIQMTKDLNSLLDNLHLDSTYIIGRSDGAIIALMMGIYFPKKVKKIAAFAANVLPDSNAIYGTNEITNDRKQADEMLAKHDTSKNWRVLQQRNRMMEFQPHISVDDLNKIICPVLILSCDRDDIKLEHTLFIYQNISKSNLCIFNGENHWITKDNPTLFNSTVDKYFSEPFKKR